MFLYFLLFSLTIGLRFKRCGLVYITCAWRHTVVVGALAVYGGSELQLGRGRSSSSIGGRGSGSRVEGRASLTADVPSGPHDDRYDIRISGWHKIGYLWRKLTANSLAVVRERRVPAASTRSQPPPSVLVLEFLLLRPSLSASHCCISFDCCLVDGMPPAGVVSCVSYTDVVCGQRRFQITGRASLCRLVRALRLPPVPS